MAKTEHLVIRLHDCNPQLGTFAATPTPPGTPPSLIEAIGRAVVANHRHATVEPAAAALLAVADVRVAGVFAVAGVNVAVGVLAGGACSLGDCPFPVAALSAVADAMSVADEVAADEPQVAPAVHCLAVLDEL
jgi:hypothetical protein